MFSAPAVAIAGLAITVATESTAKVQQASTGMVLGSIIAGIIGKTVSARFGGAFLAFPSILPASLTLRDQHAGAVRTIAQHSGACYACRITAAQGRVSVQGR